MTNTTVEGVLAIEAGIEFLVATRQGALRRLHDLARARAGLESDSAAARALAAMARAVGEVCELVDAELDDAAWAEPMRAAGGGGR